MSLQTRCPQCGKPLPFDLEEIALPNGGLVMRTVACGSCGYVSEIGRITAKGVAYRGRIAALRAVERRLPAQDRELDRLIHLYQREMVSG